MPPAPKPGKEARRHLAEAKDDWLRYQRFLKNPDDVGWGVVVLFYSALHIVQAHAVATNKANTGVRLPVNHAERASYVANHCRSIEGPYRTLEELSRTVRYDLSKMTERDAQSAYARFFEPLRAYFDQRGFGSDEERKPTDSAGQ